MSGKEKTINFRDFPIRYKLLAVYSAIFTLAIALGSLTTYAFVRRTIETGIENELRNSTATLVNMVRATSTVSIKNHLRALAEKNREIVSQFYYRFQIGDLTEEDAKLMAKGVLVSQTVGRTGYVYCLSSRGVVEVHPNQALCGSDVSRYGFVREQMERKEGYLEYEWKNPGESKERPKALYMTYFAPWDWIISVSSYRQEFTSLINVDDFRDSIASIRFGKTGYCYITDSSGNIIVHPKLTGNVLNIQDAGGRKFMKEICRRKSGKIVYMWQNPGEQSYREKLVVFDYIPEFDWIVASSSYTEEFYSPLKTIRSITIVTALITLALVLALTLWISGSITRPLGVLMRRFESGAAGNLAVRMEVRAKDEMGQLARYFNEFMERLETSNKTVQAEILERKRAEDALRKSERQLSDIIDFLPDAAMVIDARGTVTAWNRAMEAMTHVKAEDMLGKGDYEYALPFYGERRPILIDLVMQPVEEVLTKYTNLQSRGNTLFGQGHITHLGGGDLHFVGSAAALRDASGRIAGAIEIVRDVTEQYRSNKALRESETRLRTITDTAKDAIIMVDNNGMISYWNPAARAIFGYSADEALGMEFLSLFPPGPLRESYRQGFGAFRQTGEGPGIGKTFEVQALRREGAQIPIELSVSAIEIQNKWNAVAIGRDVTNRKAVEQELHRAKEEAESASRSKSAFLANMSHEIRTPMNAIMGMAHLALKTSLTPKQHDYIRKIHLSAESLLGIINDILDFSKIEAGKLDIERIDFMLDEVLESLITVTTLRAEEKGLELLLSVEPDVPQYLSGDPLRLGQVLINLTNNAIKFTEKGEIVIRVALQESEGNLVRIEFSVRDTGIGLSGEQMDKLFKSFSQADGSTTRKYGGTGLGLAISKRLVEMMDGAIWVKSEQGKGSTFGFTATFSRGKKPADSTQVSSDLYGMRVLVVDDNATSREVLKAGLEGLSFEVEGARSGAMALEMLEQATIQERPFDLVLMDWKMPGMDGIEASRRIKTNNKLARTPAILMVTAYGKEEIMDEAKGAGLDGFLVKPVNHSLLLKAILSVLGKEQAPRFVTAGKIPLDGSGLESIRGAHVLLVEDSLLNQEVATELLESAGLRVSIANNGREGVEAVLENSYDLVLMDIQMPEMDGLEACRTIRGYERLRELPILAMTAHAMAGDREKSLSAGMNDHITKPIEPSELYNALLRWIKPGKRAEDFPAPRQEEAPLDLPELPGIDSADGLRKVAGNARVYLKILKGFRADYSNASSSIDADIEAGKFDRAQRAVHTIKGVAGSIGALALFKAAGDLELSLKNGKSEETGQLRSSFKTCLVDVLTGLASLDGLECPPAAHDAPLSCKPDIEAARRAMERMARLLEDGDAEAEDIMDQLRNALSGAGVDAALDNLERHIDAFDFEDAILALDPIEKALALSREKQS